MSQVKGRISVHPRGFGFVEMEAGGAAFVAPPELNAFLDGDEVTAELKEAQDGRLSAHGLQLVHRWREELYGTVTFHGRKPFLRVDRQVSNTDWMLRRVPRELLREGARMVGRLEGVEVVPLVEVAEEDARTGEILARHGIRTAFPSYPSPAAPELTGRRDLRDLMTVTIDGPTSLDMDDALSVLPAAKDGGLRVFVSIADVDSMVPLGSPLDEEAQRRGTSVYLPGRVIPMLPRELSEDRLSLVEGQDRPALTVEIRLDPEGEVTSTDIYESVILSKHRLNYEEVAAFLEHREDHGLPEEVQTTLRWLRTAASRIAVVRGTRGGVSLDREEAVLTLDDTSGEPTGIELCGASSAHTLVERLMVAANESVARWLHSRGLPALYRVHDVPEADRVRWLAESAGKLGLETGFGGEFTPRRLSTLESQYLGTPMEPIMSQVLAQILGPARYTPEARSHFGLGAPLYLHFTSPIRRYPDLVVHRVIKAFLRGRRDFELRAPEMEDLAKHLNERARGAALAEADRRHQLMARYFSRRVGERLTGHVVGIKAFGLVVHLHGTAATGILPVEDLPGGPYRMDQGRHALQGSGRAYTLGETLTVEIRGTNEGLGRIELALP